MLEKSLPYTSAKQSNYLRKNAINILGICFDSSTTFRPGSRFGPNAIREVSYQLEEYSPYLNEDLADRKIYDLGNLRQQTLFEYHKKDFDILMKEVDLTKTRLLTLGGDHSISYLPISYYLKAFPDLVVLHLDAHTDYRDEYLNNKFSHACVIKRVEELCGENNSIMQWGIRSGTKKEFRYLKENGYIYDVSELWDAIVKLKKCPIYLTLDVDFFDPSICSGTGTPEAGGVDFKDFMFILKKISDGGNLVGADVVELSPMIDSSGNSTCLVSKVIREILLTLKI